MNKSSNNQKAKETLRDVSDWAYSLYDEIENQKYAKKQ